MNRAANKTTGALLAALATFGLAIAPVVHAELHAHERITSRKQALAVVFRLGFERQLDPDQQLELEEAYAVAFRRGKGGAPHKHHGHSHGGAGSHGSGSLEHLSLAIGNPALPLAAPPPPPLPQGRLFAPIALLFTPRYSTPEHSQAPPQA